MTTLVSPLVSWAGFYASRAAHRAARTPTLTKAQHSNAITGARMHAWCLHSTIVFTTDPIYEAWYGGGERGYELPGFIPRQSDCVALSGKSTCVCAGGDGAGDGLCVSIYDLTKGSIECHLHGHMERVVSIACDGDLIASGSRDGEIRLWTQPRRGASTGAPDGGGSGADHGGTYGGASSADGGAAGGLLATLKGCEGAVYGLALRGDVLFSGEAAPDMNPSRVAKARLWSVSQRACVATFTEHKGNVRGACGQSDAHTPVAYLQQTAQHDL